MNEASLLETTAEVSVAFTGFIGIFLVLASRDGRFPPGASFAIRLIVICSVAPVFLAVLPLILHSLGLVGSTLWRTASIAAGVAGAAGIAHLVRQVRTLPAGEGRNLNYGTVFAGVATLSCVANAIGVPWPPSGGLYLVYLWSLVAIAAGNFVELIFRRVLEPR